MSSATSLQAGSTSGIITTESGQRHIPSSTRSDGSTRKEIRIRPGYRPPEDVGVYKNRTAEAWKARGSGGIPGAENMKDDTGTSSTKASGKNAKRREARKRAKAAEADGEVGENNETATDTATPNSDSAETKNTQSPDHETTKSNAENDDHPNDSNQEPESIDSVERENRARKLKKKLREARDLEEKKEKGESLLHEQFEKVIRINELIRDLDKLGFNADGEPKRD